MAQTNTKPSQQAWLPATLFALTLLLVIGYHQASQVDYDVPEVDIPTAAALIDAGAVIIDVRSENAYEGRHIPGAMLVPLAVLRAGIPAELEGLKEKEIVVYCNKGTQVGQEATHLLNQAGFAHAVNLQSGIGGWANAGQPVITRDQAG
ncbi:rhodanese-like domain-containing protein [Marinobacter zhejiangensis]|uniref:Rhodanese-related sulfurtransferase n=1 Tax=Marinobacter zhejiangensis TaxID=488535 RepID=A0A1I4THH9_9GAMM|nr:rhodanese-like domain-containing protein [Marinobacter zhejiangensis]SFM76105.1 Rhodanese-related sulfurtransferase [Marinobacter zhejiangensis]